MISMRVSTPSAAAMCRACQSASWEPRDPMTIILPSSFPQAEQFADHTHQVNSSGIGGLLAQFSDGAVRDFVDNAAGDRLDRFLLLRRERTEFRAHPFDFRGSHHFQLFLQADDGRSDF